MDLENIFRDVKLSKTEMTVLRFIQNDPEQCVREGIRAVAEHCYSNPSSLVRLAKKLKFSGWLELVYFIKFNITMPKLDVTNDIDYMSIQPDASLTRIGLAAPISTAVGVRPETMAARFACGVRSLCAFSRISFSIASQASGLARRYSFTPSRPWMR